VTVIGYPWLKDGAVVVSVILSILLDEYGPRQSPIDPSVQGDVYHAFGVFCSGLEGKLSLDTTKSQVEQLFIPPSHLGTRHIGSKTAQFALKDGIVAQSHTKFEHPLPLHALIA
jgi:hypothetical protein